MEVDSSTLEGKVASSTSSGQTEEPEWLIPKQQVNSDDINTGSDITESLFSAGKTSSSVASKAPLIVDVNENPDDGDPLDMAQSSILSDLIIPLGITPSSSNSTVSRRPLIEEIDDSVPDNLLMNSSSNNEEGSTNFFITESNVSKAASFYSTTNKEPESAPTEFGGQWAQRTQPLIEEVEVDISTKSDTVKVEDLEDFESPQLHSMPGKASQPVGENGGKETLHEAKMSAEGETDKITELAEKAGSTLDPVTVDQALLQSLRQKYQ